jgi:hemolysin D
MSETIANGNSSARSQASGGAADPRLRMAAAADSGSAQASAEGQQARGAQQQSGPAGNGAGAPKAQPAANARPQPRKHHPGDQEFLPAALEILETPPSPVRIGMLLAICALVVVALAWAFIGRVDIVAVAQGKFQPTGRVNVVQPLETGKVKALYVSNGKAVKEGDVLIEMDPSDAQAELSSQQTLLWSFEAEILRRRAVVDAITKRQTSVTTSVAWPDVVPKDIRGREQRVLDEDMRQLRSVISSLEAQRAQKQAERERIISTIGAMERFTEVLQERVTMRETLVTRNAGARASVIDALEKLREQQTTLSQQRGQLKETEASLVVLAQEIEKTYQSAAADNTQRLAAMERQRDETAQRVVRAQTRVSNMKLRAPNSGTVQALSVINPGQVLSAGEQIMRVVPDGVGLEIEVYVLNKDIGFIKEGQEAIIKLEAFPFTKYGTITAEVVRIARDAIPQPEAGQIESNPAQSIRSGAFAGAQRTQNLVYQVVLKPANETIGVENETIKLLPGMSATAEIKTGKRRMIDFVFSPLMTLGSQSMRER